MWAILPDISSGSIRNKMNLPLNLNHYYSAIKVFLNFYSYGVKILVLSNNVFLALIILAWNKNGKDVKLLIAKNRPSFFKWTSPNSIDIQITY